MFSNKLHEKAHETLKGGNIDEAIKLYTQALEQNPMDCDILSDRGVAYLHKNDPVNCLKDLDHCVELQPEKAYRYASRAFAKSHFKDQDGAIADYEIAVKLDPDDAVAHNNLGMLLEQKGYQDEAKERFERADNLSKQEDHLIQMLDEMEETETSEKGAQEEKVEESPKPQSTTEEQQVPEQTAGSEFKKLFTSRKQFREFIQFVKNGFKIK